ncbi:hypothetical protein BDV18DRAFT_163232 [Aspergillus unguis]
MDINTDINSSPLSSLSSEFTPINSPAGERIEAINEAIKEEVKNENDEIKAGQSLIAVKEGETETNSTPSKASASLNTNGNDTKETPTPRKRARKPTASNTTTPVKKTKTKKDGADDTEPSTPGAATATTPATPGTSTSTATGAATPGSAARGSLPRIPTSLAAAGEEDRMILRLRDEGKPWSEINKAFVDATGIKIGASTLRMRYTTMKANFTGVTEEDETRLMRIKKEIEEKFETEKWHRIVEAVSQDGGGKYPAATLQKKFKEISKREATATSTTNGA